MDAIAKRRTARRQRESQYLFAVTASPTGQRFDMESSNRLAHVARDGKTNDQVGILGHS